MSTKNFDTAVKMKKLLIAFGAAVIAGGLALAAIGFIKGTDSPAAYTAAAAVWVSLIASQVIFWLANKIRKTNDDKDLRGMGAFRFFSSREAGCADGALILSVVWVTYMAVSLPTNKILVTTAVALLYMSLNFHCMFNGINYRYVKKFCKGVQKK